MATMNINMMIIIIIRIIIFSISISTVSFIRICNCNMNDRGTERNRMINHGGAMIMIRLFMPLIIQVAVEDTDETYDAGAAENRTLNSTNNWLPGSAGI